MSSDVVISVENLSKSYLIGHDGPRESYHSLRDTIARHGKNYLRKAVDMARGRQIIQGDSVEEFWALKDVSFEVKQGEVLGIIGRNGAGKSTLLKILSRITEPTSGRVTLDGRVASLLEVGTGFHPELTGRENIFLNGAILGMTKAEIRKKFDEIVEFAGVEKFLDTPVKRYSSGMYVRLAFAVAAHLEPEILIIDEVLAVGDAEFQKKCLGKMQEVGTSGRTVIFVSHQMSAVRQLCHQSLWLQNGSVRERGHTEDVLAHYLSSSTDEAGKTLLIDRSDRQGSGELLFAELSILDEAGKRGEGQSGSGCYFEVSITNKNQANYSNCVLSVDIYDEFDNRVLLLRSNLIGKNIDIRNSTEHLQVFVPSLPLASGKYRISLYLGQDSHGYFDYVENAGILLVRAGDYYRTGHEGYPALCRNLAAFDIECKSSS
jgi:lipopolysaccharide transport system ATP-binding protein